MTIKLPLPPPGFDELTFEDKIDYLQSLWDRIAAKPEQVPVPDWHRQVLHERIASHEANPEQGRSWEEIREEIRSKLGDRKSER